MTGARSLRVVPPPPAWFVLKVLGLAALAGAGWWRGFAALLLWTALDVTVAFVRGAQPRGPR